MLFNKVPLILQRWIERWKFLRNEFEVGILVRRRDTLRLGYDRREGVRDKPPWRIRYLLLLDVRIERRIVERLVLRKCIRNWRAPLILHSNRRWE